MANGSGRSWGIQSLLLIAVSALLLGLTGTSAAVAQAPEITSPVPAGVLPGANVTFQWTANSTAVTEWWLYVGSSLGGTDILNTGALGASLTANVSGLPVDGRTIWVRLWFRVDGLWESADFQFTAANAALARPRLISPAPGSTLPGGTATFQWTDDGAAVEEWALAGGSTEGAFDLFDAGSVGTAYSATIATLPTDGRVVWIRLRWRIGSAWSVANVYYVAALAGGTPTPRVTSPVPGSILPGASASFQWIANSVAVTQWWLYVGSSPGASDIFDSGALGNSLSLTVNGLPIDGRTLWAGLWYFEGVWKLVSFPFVAANGAAGTPRITSPAAGAVLAGSTVAIHWTADGAAVTEWALWAGSSQGTSDLFDSGLLNAATLSTTLAGLPTDGRSVWLRLRYRIGGSWSFWDAQYTASTQGVPVTPAILSPSPGSALGASTVTFSWNAYGAAVTEWWLWVGTDPGGSDLWDSGALGASLSATVSGLPTSGDPIHVRLWFRVAGLWEFADFQYSVDAGAPEVPWSLIGAGGASSLGGVFRLDGSIGQPVTATSTVGGIVLRGGFWPVVLIP